MAVTENTYTGNGSTDTYSFTFPYLDAADIKVSLNGTPTTAYTLATATTIQFNTAPANGVAIRIYRETDDTALVATFVSGSAIRAVDLNENFTQNLYVTQESNNNASQAVTTSNAANATSAAALAAATTAESNSVAAVNTSNTAEANSIAAVNTANTAEANSIAAVNTSNLANTKSDQAIAAAAVFLVYDPIANVAAIPGSPANLDLIEVQDSTGLENFTPLTGVPAGFVGDVGVPVKLKYTTAGNTWNWVSYYIIDPEARYLNRYSDSVVIHVDALNGDDANDGSTVKPKQTIKAAVAAASAGDIIRVAPGVYQETLPIDITVPNLSIIGESARSVFMHPTVATETNTMFRCNSGTYISGLVFCGLKASGTRGNNPIDDDPTYGLPENQGWVAAFYPGAIIRKSPWIENCTNFSDSGIDNSNFNPSNYSGTGGDVNSGMTGGGVLVDGSVPDVTSPLRSFVVNEFTQVCLDGPGMLVCNNGYAQAVSFFGLFCHYHAKALSGGQINMEVGTTNFGRYGLIADGKSDTAIFTATANGAATSGDVTFTINAPTADASWFGDANRPAINMLVKIGSDIYPILSSSANGSGWNVTISRPDPTDRSVNLGLINGHANGATVEFFLRSMISTASHTFEYAGSGTNYTALPENGGEAIEANEALALNDGRVWLTSTDQAGKFKVGDTFQVDQQTGYVTIDPNSVAVNIVSDGTPQLGGDLDVLARKITTSQANNPVIIDGNGTGGVSLRSGGVERFNVGTSQVTAGFLGTAAAPAYSFTADPDTGLLSTGANELALSTGGTARLTIDASGNVAIGGGLTKGGNSVLTTADLSTSTSSTSTTTAATSSAVKTTYDLANAALPASGGALTGDLTLNAQSDLRFADADSSNWVGFQAPATVSSNVTWTLPSADGSSGQVLSTDGTGTLSWSTASGGGGATDKIEEGNTSAEVIDTGSDGRFVVTTEGAQRLLIDSSGNVGIGTTSPQTKLEVSDNSATEIEVARFRTNGNTNNPMIRFLVDEAANLRKIDATGSVTGALAFNQGVNERMRIDSSGRLLVGTSSTLGGIAGIGDSDQEFISASSVASIVCASNGNNAYGGFLLLANSRGGTTTIVQNDDQLGAVRFGGADGTDLNSTGASITAFVDGTPGANDMPGRLVFSTTADGASSPTERMRITQNGFTKHSNTGTYLSTTAPYHEFRSDAGSGTVTLNVLNSNAAGNGIQSNLNSDGTAYAFFIGYSTSATTNRIVIWSNGNVVNTNNSYGAISDIKLKENIVDANSQWDDLKALQVRNYNFKEGQTHTQIGLVAQEVELVSPGLVTESPDRDADGNDLGTVTKSVNYSVLYMKAVKALQEAMERIETLETKVAALEAA